MEASDLKWVYFERGGYGRGGREAKRLRSILIFETIGGLFIYCNCARPHFFDGYFLGAAD